MTCIKAFGQLSRTQALAFFPRKNGVRRDIWRIPGLAYIADPIINLISSMATATTKKTTSSATSRTTTAPRQNVPLFGKENYKWMLIGIILIALGLFLMGGGKSKDPNVFNPKEVYVYAMGQEPWLEFISTVKYTDESNPIIQSNELIKLCREKGLIAERLFGEKEILYDYL